MQTALGLGLAAQALSPPDCRDSTAAETLGFTSGRLSGDKCKGAPLPRKLWDLPLLLDLSEPTLSDLMSTGDLLARSQAVHRVHGMLDCTQGQGRDLRRPSGGNKCQNQILESPRQDASAAAAIV